MTNNKAIESAVREIKLGRGEMIALVDEQDYAQLSKYKWSPHNDQKGIRRTYVKTNDGTNILMHRMIMEPPEGLFIDHVNGNGLDNRRSNLRICNYSQNAGNRFKRRGKYTSRFKGVSWEKGYGKWLALLPPFRQNKLFYTDSEVEAAVVYDIAAKIYYGEFAKTNEMMGLYKPTDILKMIKKTPIPYKDSEIQPITKKPGNYSRKITPELVSFLRADYAATVESGIRYDPVPIAKKHGMGYDNLKLILKNKGWMHIPLTKYPYPQRKIKYTESYYDDAEAKSILNAMMADLE